MEDKKGQELLRVHAHRDNLVTVGGSQTVDVGGNQKIHVKGTRDDHVEGAVTEAWDTSLTTTIGGPQSTKAEAVTEEYASLDTTVKGVHHEKFGTMGIEGGDVKWSVGQLAWLTGAMEWQLKGPGHITAPRFVFDVPDFVVNHAGSHTETKGNWLATAATKAERVGFKIGFYAVDVKLVDTEIKVHAISANVGQLKLETLGAKIERNGIISSTKIIDLKKEGASVSQIGSSLIFAGIFVLG
jgi:type VI secretion system secreted protein VgrG